MVNLRCPVCAGALKKRAGAYLCPKNHSFDIAKSGYVNLLLNSSQGHHGDDKLMVRARRDFLDKGYYDRFIAAVADAAAEFTPPEATVLDAGCGEGIYSLAVLRAIEKAGKHGKLLGVDISKTALQYASKRSPDFTLCVASCAHLPVEDGSVDEVLNIFSPFVPEEFARVLKPGGYLLRAYPLREHLWELKALIYDTPRDNPPTPLTTEGFTLVETREVRDIIHLSCNEDILSLFRMTPYYYKTGAKDQQKAERAQELDVQLAFGLAVYQRIDDTPALCGRGVPATAQGCKSKGPFSFAKENGPFGTPRERLLIGSLRLECPFCLRNETACARQSRVSIARRFGLLLLSAAALLIL